MRNVRGTLLLVIVLVFLTGCQNEITDMQSFHQWINDPSNGLTKTKHVGDYKITVKCLPSEFLALREVKEETKPTQPIYDSLLSSYKNTLTFLLMISATSPESQQDPMFKELEGLPEYKERAGEMNFNMDSYVSIKTSSGEYKPVLTTMENTYGLRNQRVVYIVFADDKHDGGLLNQPKWDFIFNDEIFNTGINHFVFQSSDLADMPIVEFENIK
jgi:hypothetical protein